MKIDLGLASLAVVITAASTQVYMFLRTRQLLHNTRRKVLREKAKRLVLEDRYYQSVKDYKNCSFTIGDGVHIHIIRNEGGEETMMEKYGVSQEDLPVTDDQIKEMGRLAVKAGIDYIMPRNKKEAEGMIAHLTKEAEAKDAQG